MPITNDQIAQIQQMVQTLVADKGDADAKSQAANAADTVVAQSQAKLSQDQAASAQAKLDEAAADAKATADLTALEQYLKGLVEPTPAPAPAPNG